MIERGRQGHVGVASILALLLIAQRSRWRPSTRRAGPGTKATAMAAMTAAANNGGPSRTSVRWPGPVAACCPRSLVVPTWREFGYLVALVGGSLEASWSRMSLVRAVSGPLVVEVDDATSTGDARLATSSGWRCCRSFHLLISRSIDRNGLHRDRLLEPLPWSGQFCGRGLRQASARSIGCSSVLRLDQTPPRRPPATGSPRCTAPSETNRSGRSRRAADRRRRGRTPRDRRSRGRSRTRRS